MEAYLSIVRSLVKNFEEHTIQQISRDLNTQVDALATFGYTSEPSLRRSIPISFIERLSIEVETTINTKEFGEDWRTPIVAYLKEGLLLKDKQEARRIRTKVARFSLINEVLYRHSFNGPYTHCLDKREVAYVLQEIHEGKCGNYSGEGLYATKPNDRALAYYASR